MYSSEFQESLKAVEAAREENIKYRADPYDGKRKGRPPCGISSRL